jgi:hypothetical protein
MEVVLIFFSLIFNGYTLSFLWKWFIIPMFNLPDFSLPHFIGLSLTISFLTMRIDVREKFKDEHSRELKMILVKPVLVLILGWIIQLFI